MLNLKALLQKMTENVASLGDFPSATSFVAHKYGLVSAKRAMAKVYDSSPTATQSTSHVYDVTTGRYWTGTSSNPTSVFHFLGVRYKDGLYLVFVSGLLTHGAATASDTTFVAYQGTGYGTRYNYQFQIPNTISYYFSGQQDMIIIGSDCITTTFGFAPYIYHNTSNDNYYIRVTTHSCKGQSDTQPMNFIIACMP